MQAEVRTPEEVQAALERVLGGRTEDTPTLFDRLSEWLDARLGLEASSLVARVLLWTALVVLVFYLVRFLARLARESWIGASRFDPDQASAGPSIAERVATLRREASAARARGDLRLALRRLLFALVLGLGGKGDLEFRDAWTYRELLERGKPAPETNRVLAALVADLEAKEFGRVPVGGEDLDRLEGLCRRYLGEAA